MHDVQYVVESVKGGPIERPGNMIYMVYVVRVHVAVDVECNTDSIGFPSSVVLGGE